MMLHQFMNERYSTKPKHASAAWLLGLTTCQRLSLWVTWCFRSGATSAAQPDKCRASARASVVTGASDRLQKKDLNGGRCASGKGTTEEYSSSVTERDWGFATLDSVVSTGIEQVFWSDDGNCWIRPQSPFPLCKHTLIRHIGNVPNCS